MHEVAFYTAVAWLALLLATLIGVLWRARTPLPQILAMDTLTLVLVALLTVIAAGRGSGHYLDAALVLALLAFVATLAAARYVREGRVF